MTNEKLAADLRERADRLAIALEEGERLPDFDYDLMQGLGDLQTACSMVKARYHTSYRFEHISDLLKLHDHHIEVFCEELPTLIRSGKDAAELVGLASALLDSQNTDDEKPVMIDFKTMMPHVTWEADNLNQAKCKVMAGGEHLGDFVVNGDKA